MELQKTLEKRMYFLVPYNISPIQQAIQAGHAALEYAHHYGDTELFKDFIIKHKTWMILNGGTTNNKYELGSGDAIGTLNKSLQEIGMFNNNHHDKPELKIKTATFQEPDLNDALTAVCLIVDERVFNRKDYPDFMGWVAESEIFVSADDKENWDNLKEAYVKEVGEDIAFLKELLNTKKLA